MMMLHEELTMPLPCEPRSPARRPKTDRICGVVSPRQHRAEKRPLTRDQPTGRRSKIKQRTVSVPVDRSDLLEHVRRLLELEIGFIHNGSFLAADAAKEILKPLAAENLATPRLPRLPGDTPAYFAHLYATPLLSTEREQYLFRKMNFLKFRANQLRAGLDPTRPDGAAVAEIECRLTEAAEVRDELVRANLRLVVSIARRFVDECNEFDELVSDGNLTLMNAVEKFDYARGFRFSTYATHAIQRDYYRQSRRRRTERSRAARGVDDLIADAPDDAPDPAEGEKYRRYRRLTELMQGELDERELYVLTMRLGLDLNDGPQTLQVIGARLGVSKERVRQLELRAIAKLQQAAKAERLT